MFTHWLGRLFGLPAAQQVESIEGVEMSAAWAREGPGPFWVFLGVVALLVLSLLFYLVFQQRGTLAQRAALGVCRALILLMAFLAITAPVVRYTVGITQRPYLYLVFDGTDSMAIEDELTEQERIELARAVGQAVPDAKVGSGSRLAYLKKWIGRRDENLLSRLQAESDYRLQAFLFDGNSTSQVRRLQLGSDDSDEIDPRGLAEQLTAKGQVTALGAVLGDLSRQLGGGNLAGVVLFSDFAHNSGGAPLGLRSGRDSSPAQRLAAPIYTVGLGAVEAKDLAVDIQTDPKMKRAEKTTILVKLRQSGLVDQHASVRVVAHRLSPQQRGDASQSITVGRQTITLTAPVETLDFPFTPLESGRFEFSATVDPIQGEVVQENNRSAREVNIIDDYLRLMYVANQPTWEWRFVKEVFHRDELVGTDGFRTFLASSDPRVRESNVLFLSTLTPQRSEFFANDVVFLGDMPRAALSDRFCTMVEQFVGKFGGGLVVIVGPRFGLSQLADTPLADMLPVVIDPDLGIRDSAEFALRLTPHAARYPFMQLGAGQAEHSQAWDNLSRLPWYQPVAGLHSQAYALAQHPSDKCSDGVTPQPLIAIRKYGNGEVVYLAMNETWRLRRKYAERYYRQFWSQLIYRLGMSHALGNEKRFVVRTDRQQYRAEEMLTLTVEAYNENFDPLTDANLADGFLAAKMTITPPNATQQTQPLRLPLLRDGVFEARLPLYAVGRYRIDVEDPVTGQTSEVRFEVGSLSAERRSGVRNLRLQQDLAQQTGGRSYDLTNVSQLLEHLRTDVDVQTEPRVHPLWNTWFWFVPVVSLMLTEWFVRKRIHLT